MSSRVIVTRKAEQNYTDAQGNRICLRRIEGRDADEATFTLNSRKGLFKIGRASGLSSISRGDQDQEATWWWVAPYDQNDRDGYEALHENGYRTVKQILIDQGAVDTAS